MLHLNILLRIRENFHHNLNIPKTYASDWRPNLCTASKMAPATWNICFWYSYLQIMIFQANILHFFEFVDEYCALITECLWISYLTLLIAAALLLKLPAVYVCRSMTLRSNHFVHKRHHRTICFIENIFICLFWEGF